MSTSSRSVSDGATGTSIFDGFFSFGMEQIFRKPFFLCAPSSVVEIQLHWELQSPAPMLLVGQDGPEQAVNSARLLMSCRWRSDARWRSNHVESAGTRVPMQSLAVGVQQQATLPSEMRSHLMYKTKECLYQTMPNNNFEDKRPHPSFLKSDDDACPCPLSPASPQKAAQN